MIELSAVLSTFALLFIAEMGDKTQLMAITLAHRYRVLPVVAGVFLAFLVLNGLAVWVGEALYRYLPQRWVWLAAGILFLIFAYRSWRDAAAPEEAESDTPPRAHHAFLASFSLIFLAELGDKTQLAMIAMVAATGSAWSVFVGGTLALWAVSLLGILLGVTLLRRVPKAWMHRAAAVLFLLFGAVAIGRAAIGDSTGPDATDAPRSSPPATVTHPS